MLTLFKPSSSDNRKLSLTLILCLAITLLLGSINTTESADLQKGLDAYNNKDYAAALREWRPLAEQGSAAAQLALGNMYDNGRGVTQDYKAAFKWYTLAAEQGDAVAQYGLGNMYDNGEGVTQDYKAAIKWYLLAAEKGITPAQHNIGAMYSNGRGVTQDNVYAHMWFNIASSSGNEQATKNRNILTKIMTSADISAAQALARECVRKEYKGC